MTRAIAFGLASAVLLAAAKAEACGGFFCDSPPDVQVGNVVEQSSERIVFVQEADRVRAIIQISYTGDPVDFAWVVPVPSRPEIDVADPAIFGAFEAVTAPQWVQPSADGADMGRASSRSGGCDDGCGGGCDEWQDDSVRPRPSTLQIESVANIGAYSVTVVTAQRTSDLTDWLSANVYTVPASATDIIGQYVDAGFFFVALRLQASADASDIEPLSLEFDAGEPCVPLRLTSIAAQPDMDVTLFVLGDAQAAPTTYAKVALAERDIGVAGAADYGALVSSEVDRAGGRGFVTEYAGPTSAIPDLSSGSAEAEALVRSSPHLTRLRTRIDPEEMTEDPLFEFDPDLTDVSNVHVLPGAYDYYGRVDRARARTLASAAPLAVLGAALLATRRRRP